MPSTIVCTNIRDGGRCTTLHQIAELKNRILHKQLSQTCHKSVTFPIEYELLKQPLWVKFPNNIRILHTRVSVVELYRG